MENEQHSVNDLIFNLLDSFFLKIRADSSSTAVFYSLFFRKCKEKGVFDVLVRHIVDVAHNIHNLTDMQTLFEHVVDLGIRDKRGRKDFIFLWNETFETLDEKTRASSSVSDEVKCREQIPE